MSELFFENPLYVYIALGLAELVLLAIWWERRSRRIAVGMLVPVVLAGVTAAVAYWVVTDREQIAAVARNIAEGIETGKLEGIERHLAEDFQASLRGRTIDRDQAAAVARDSAQRYGITRIAFNNLRIDVGERSAEMHVNTIITFKGAEYEGKTSLVWDLRWVEEGGQWRILEVGEPRTGIELGG